MAKINVCDICMKDGKLVQTHQYMKVTSRPDLKLDYCPGCKSKIPEDMTAYVKLVYGTQGIELDDERARELAKRR